MIPSIYARDLSVCLCVVCTWLYRRWYIHAGRARSSFNAAWRSVRRTSARRRRDADETRRRSLVPLRQRRRSPVSDSHLLAMQFPLSSAVTCWTLHGLAGSNSQPFYFDVTVWTVVHTRAPCHGVHASWRWFSAAGKVTAGPTKVTAAYPGVCV